MLSQYKRAEETAVFVNLASAGQQYLGESIRDLRRLHPKVKMKMIDLTPGEVISALRRGEIDLELSYLGMDLLSRDFYARQIVVGG